MLWMNYEYGRRVIVSLKNNDVFWKDWTMIKI